MTFLEAKMVDVLNEIATQRDLEGKVRWRYVANWMANVLKSQNPNFDAQAFYEAINAPTA